MAPARRVMSGLLSTAATIATWNSSGSAVGLADATSLAKASMKAVSPGS